VLRGTGRTRRKNNGSNPPPVSGLEGSASWRCSQQVANRGFLADAMPTAGADPDPSRRMRWPKPQAALVAPCRGGTCRENTQWQVAIHRRRDIWRQQAMAGCGNGRERPEAAATAPLNTCRSRTACIWAALGTAARVAIVHSLQPATACISHTVGPRTSLVSPEAQADCLA
jgi:hypothetical protein